ncbi:MAG: acetyl-CoA carboxylase biotin carboxyl carrier protein [Rhodothermales bacterium]
MDLARIRELLKIVAESDVAELEIEEEGVKLVVRKNAATVMVQSPPVMAPYGLGYAPPVYPQMPPPPPVATYAPAPEAPPPTPVPTATPSATFEGEVVAPESGGVEVRAPIVGTFYRAPGPDADAYVNVGDTVRPGDVLCIIEAMKLMNEIECEMAGTIQQILVENAEAVEYDQPLFIIEPA